MDLSVVICSYNRYGLLAESVRAVEESISFDRRTMELIVVENTPPAMRRRMTFDKRTRVVVCDEPGLSNARNMGIDAAVGDIVAFLDDDAFVSANWCAAAVSAFRDHPKAAACGGRTLPRFSSDRRPKWYHEALAHYLSCIDWGDTAQPLAPGQWIVGANMAFRRAIFAEVGRFDPALGRKGEASLLSNEEIALLRRIGRDRVYYVPGMVVEHLVPGERLSLEWFRKRVFWQAVSDVLAGETYKTPREAAADLYDIVARAPAEYRGHRLISFDPADAEQFKDQLSAVYLQAMLMAQGFPRELVRA
jgi:GT2 family glycosyltransferase